MISSSPRVLLTLFLVLLTAAGCTAFGQADEHHRAPDTLGGGEDDVEDTEDVGVSEVIKALCEDLCGFELLCTGDNSLVADCFDECVENAPLDNPAGQLISCRLDVFSTLSPFVEAEGDPDLQGVLCGVFAIPDADSCEQLRGGCGMFCESLGVRCCELIDSDDQMNCPQSSELIEDCEPACALQILIDLESGPPGPGNIPFECESQALAALQSLDPGAPLAILHAVHACSAANPAIPSATCSYAPCEEFCVGLLSGCGGHPVLDDYGIDPESNDTQQFGQCLDSCTANGLTNNNDRRRYTSQVGVDSLQCRALNALIAGASIEGVENSRSFCNFAALGGGGVCPLDATDHDGDGVIAYEDPCPYVADSVQPFCNGALCSAESPNCDGDGAPGGPDGTCEDLSSDPSHCGACNNACLPDQACLNGICADECPPEGCTAACGDGDVFACAPGEVCAGSVCACGARTQEGRPACGEGETCSDDLCQCGQTTGEADAPACLGVSICVNDVCGPPTPCTNGVACGSGEACVSNECVCGSFVGSDGPACGPNERCVDGACTCGETVSPTGAACETSEVCDPIIQTCRDTQNCSCGPGLSCCDSDCLDLWTDPLNCGVCFNVCPEQSTCVEGRCVDCAESEGDPDCNNACNPLCAPNEICCGNDCVDPNSDEGHCGGCDLDCADNSVSADAYQCIEGRCSCDLGLNECETGCVEDLDCPPGARCLADSTGVMVCVNSFNEPTLCGDDSSSGMACGPGERCQRGQCVCSEFEAGQVSGGPACILDEVCCHAADPDPSCNDPAICTATCTSPEERQCSNGACANIMRDDANCGACDVQCSTNEACLNGYCIDNIQ